MAQVPPLSLSDIVDITVTIAPSAATANPFNQGLFVGPSTVIPSYGTNPRLRQYTSTTAMLSDGFTSANPEFVAAQIYWSQTPVAQYLWIGRQDLTAVGTATPVAEGTGYKVGDQVTVTQAGGSYGTLTVLTIGVGGEVVTVGTTAGSQGTGYTSASALPTVAVSPSTGTGLTVTIVAGESLLEAAQACRIAGTLWYGLAVNNPSDTDNLAISEWADALWQTTRYYPWSSDLAIPNGVAANVALQLQALDMRVLGTYSTTQSGLYPNNIYAAAGAMGVEMGLNTGLAGSFFTTAHKAIAGIAPEPLSQTQYANIVAAGFNAYCNFSPYQFYEPGFTSNGAPAYLWINLAMLVANMQINVLNVLASNVAVPQTNQGEQLLIDAVNQADVTAASIGFLSGANWTGEAVIVGNVTIANGTALPSGYMNLAAPYATQSSGDRAAGKAMPIISLITTAGAVQSLVIGVYTQL